MSPSKKPNQDGHTISRGKIYIVCLGKSNRPNITPSTITLLHEHTSIFDDVSPSDERVPTGICPKCRWLLGEKKKGKALDKSFQIPIDFKYITNVIIKKNDLGICECTLCKIATSFDGTFTQTYQPKKSCKVEKKTPSRVTEEKRLCSECLSVIGKGFTHICNDHTTLENLKILQQQKPIVAEAFAAHVIKTKPGSPKGTQRLSVLHGPKLPVTIGSAEQAAESISHEKVIEFQKHANLSQNQT